MPNWNRAQVILHIMLHPRYGELFEKREKAIKSFGLWMKSMLQQSKISVKNTHQDIFPKTPPWILEKSEVILKLNELPKTKTHPCTYIEKFHHIVSHYPEHLHVFTDGSKDHSRTVCAAVLNKIIHKKGSSNGKLHLYCRSMCYWPCSQHHF